MRSARVWSFVVGLLSLVFLFAAQSSFAQTTRAVTSSPPVNSFNAPNTDSDVPRNQHTYAQSVTIEVMSAIMCQLTGIDPVDSTKPCLGINPQTHKLGYGPSPATNNISGANQATEPQLGGILGFATDMIATTYTPTVTTGVYTQYLSDNFGIVKKTYAAGESNGYGFAGLKPVFKLWIAVRNIAYGLLIFAFAFIGVGIMLRVKIDPRTVMTIQNQIPKVIVAIILITFSYAFSALLIDLMWLSTYAGVDMIVSNTEVTDTLQKAGLPKAASKNLLELPLIYVNNVFYNNTGSGIFHLTEKVSSNIGKILQNSLEKVFNFNCGLNWTTLLSVGSNCALQNVLTFLTNIALKLIIFVVLIVALFKIWFNLLKAYVYTLVYVIVAPVMIVFGLLPSKPMGFENWLRRLFVNIAAFPLTAFMIVGARVLMDVYDNSTLTSAQKFIPPLIGHTANTNFGAILAFGTLLMTPHIQTILQEKMGVKGVGSPGLLAAGIAGGAAVIGAPVGRAVKHLNRTDNQGNAVGAMAFGKKNAAKWVTGKASNIPLIGGAAKRLQSRRDFEENLKPNEAHGPARAAYRKAVKEGPSSKYWSEKDKEGNLLHPEGPPPQTSYRARSARRAANRTSPTNPTGSSRLERVKRSIFNRGERGSLPTPPSLRRPTETPATPVTPATGGAGGAAGGAGGAGGAGASSSTGHTGAVINAPGAKINIPGAKTSSGGGGSERRGMIEQALTKFQDKLKTEGKSPLSNKQNLVIKVEDMLERGGPGTMPKDDSEWADLFKKAQEEREQEERSSGGPEGGSKK